jgi:hypothetical protein
MTTGPVYREISIPGKCYESNYNSPPIVASNDQIAVDYEDRPVSVNADRHKRLKSCAAYYHYGSNFRKNTGTIRYSDSQGPWHWFASDGNIFHGHNFAVPVEPSSNQRNACLVKALTKLKAQDFHLGNFVAEGHKVIEMVAHRATQIANSVQKFRRTRPKDFDCAKRYEGAVGRHDWHLIPNSWLELQYGWNPLMQDIQGALMHLQKRSRFSNPIVTVRASVSDFVESTIDGACFGSLTFRNKFRHERRVDTFLTYGSTSPILAELSSLGLINPLEIVWELTKYSFVVDWFAPIGPWLGSLTADVGYTFITGGQSSKVTCTFADSTLISQDPLLEYDTITYPAFTGRRMHFNRSCYSSAPVPGLYVKNPLSTVHLANALALLSQAFT